MWWSPTKETCQCVASYSASSAAFLSRLVIAAFSRLVSSIAILCLGSRLLILSTRRKAGATAWCCWLSVLGTNNIIRPEMPQGDNGTIRAVEFSGLTPFVDPPLMTRHCEVQDCPLFE